MVEYDLVVLDLNLPGMDGFQLLREIRTVNAEVKVPILSARDGLEDKVRGLDAGANDYLTKPFHFAELEARSGASCAAGLPSRIDFSPSGALCWIPPPTRWRRPTAPDATRKEYALLEYLLLHRGIVSAEEFMEHVWDGGVDSLSNALRVIWPPLRKKPVLLWDVTSSEPRWGGIPSGRGGRRYEGRSSVSKALPWQTPYPAGDDRHGPLLHRTGGRHDRSGGSDALYHLCLPDHRHPWGRPVWFTHRLKGAPPAARSSFLPGRKGLYTRRIGAWGRNSNTGLRASSMSSVPSQWPARPHMISENCLSPLVNLKNQVANLSAQNLSDSPEGGAPQTGDEIESLSNAFQGMRLRLDSAFETQKRFAANAAHELRTPLAAIQTRLDVFSKHEDHTEEEYQALIGSLRRQTERLSLLVKDLLDMSCMEEVPMQDAIDVAPLMDRDCPRAGALGGEKGAELPDGRGGHRTGQRQAHCKGPSIIWRKMRSNTARTEDMLYWLPASRSEMC